MSCFHNEQQSTEILSLNLWCTDSYISIHEAGIGELWLLKEFNLKQVLIINVNAGVFIELVESLETVGIFIAEN